MRFDQLLLTLLLGSALNAVAARPNIVLILADDLGWRDTGATGSHFYQTPNIDALATRSLRFKQSYAASPLCSPTRASILTGMNPARLGFTAAWGHKEEDRLSGSMPATADPQFPMITPLSATRLSPGNTTLPQILKASGYATALFGKWHLGRNEYMPDRYGFDLSMPNSPEPLPRGYYAPYKTQGMPANAPEGEHIDERIAQEAADFIAGQGTRPYFLAYWPFSVHYPYHAKRQMVKEHLARVDSNYPQRNPVMAAMIEHLDRSVGTIIKAVNASERADNTIIVFTSDNGGVNWMGASKKYPDPVTDNFPLRGGKAQLYEGGLRVPLFFSWPGEIKPGLDQAHITSSEDILPTLLDLVGIELPAQTDGLSQADVLLAREVIQERKTLLAHMPHYVEKLDAAPVSSLRMGGWKLLRFYGDDRDGGDRYELYNLNADIGESDNLIGEQAEIETKMRIEMDRQLANFSALLPVKNPVSKVPDL